MASSTDGAASSNQSPNTFTNPTTSNNNTAITLPSFTPTTGTEGIIHTRAMSIASQEAAGAGSGSGNRGHSPSPRMSLSSSLQAAATVNAGLRSEEECSRRNSVSSNQHHARTSRSSSQTPSTPHQRRRSTVLLNLQMNDPSIPAPGEMVSSQQPLTVHSNSTTPRSLTASPSLVPMSRDPSHNRNPSLGEIHQTLEQEQEAQVNRLLQMIRVQQAQLQALQAQRGYSPGAASTSAVVGDEIPHFDPLTHTPAALASAGSPSARMPGIHPRSSFDLARSDIQRRSRTPSRNASPSFRAPSTGPGFGLTESGTWALGDSAMSGPSSGVSTRDESAFYQAETQMMVRENQMLRQRIRELERQQAERMGEDARVRELTREPTTPSCLLKGVSAREDGNGSGEASPRGTPVLREG